MREREDTSHQEAAVEQARSALDEAYRNLTLESGLAGKRVRSRRASEFQVLEAGADVQAAWRACVQAEENLLIAMRDLAGARGEDL